MNSLQDQQFALDKEIFGEILKCVPPQWKKIGLHAASTSSDSASMSIHIDANGQAGIGIVSDELAASIRRLFLLHKEHKTGLLGVFYTFEKTPQGKWKFTCDFKYKETKK